MKKQPIRKQLVILAKSRKYRNYCVAGITIGEDGGEYIRIGKGKMCAELSEKDLTIGGRSVQILDKVTVDVEKLPPASPQIENYELRSIVSIDGKITQDEFKRIISEITEEPFIFTNTRWYLKEDEFLSAKGSLIFAKVTDVYLEANNDEKGKPHFSCDFRYGGILYEYISVTDPRIRDIAVNKMESDNIDFLSCFLCDEMYIMFSLPNPKDEWSIGKAKYYKFAAGMIPPMF